MKSKENNILRALMRTVALPAAALTLPVSQVAADPVTSWEASRDSVNAVADADLTAVEAQSRPWTLTLKTREPIRVHSVLK